LGEVVGVLTLTNEEEGIKILTGNAKEYFFEIIKKQTKMSKNKQNVGGAQNHDEASCCYPLGQNVLWKKLHGIEE